MNAGESRPFLSFKENPFSPFQAGATLLRVPADSELKEV